jgi:hypothetical protein
MLLHVDEVVVQQMYEHLLAQRLDIVVDSAGVVDRVKLAGLYGPKQLREALAAVQAGPVAVEQDGTEE